MTVLVVCLRYLGDTLLLRPAFHALREAFPEAKLDALVTGGTRVALDDCPNVDRVIEWPKGNLAGQAGILARVAATGYDWVVDFTGNDRSALVALASRASVRAVYDRPKISQWSIRRKAYNRLIPPKVKKPHAILQRLELLEALGVKSQGVSIDLVPRDEELKWVDSLGLKGEWVHVHLTSRDMEKAVPAGVAQAVFEGVVAAGVTAVVTTGAGGGERSHMAECLKNVPADRIKVFSDLTWHQLVALISRCGKYWGADTAPSHIAAAFEKPMLIHYGPSKAEHWKPLHAEGIADVIPSKNMGDIDPDRVLRWMKGGSW